MMKQSANSAVRFTSYQAMKDYAMRRNGGQQPGNTTIMAIGAVAGVITVCEWMKINCKSKLIKVLSPLCVDTTMPFELVFQSSFQQWMN